MSQPASPKGNFIQTLLIVAVIFLGIQLWQSSNKPKPDPRDPAAIMKTMEQEVRDIKDLSAKNKIPIAQAINLKQEAAGAQGKVLEFRQVFANLTIDQSLRQLELNNELGTDLSMVPLTSAFESKVNAQKSAATNKLTKERARELEIAGQTLLAHTQYKAAIQRKDFNKIVPAHDSLSRIDREYSKDPAYLKPVKLVGAKDVAGGEMSAKDLTAIVDQVSYKLGKETPVWGFFPGYQFIDFIVHLTGANPAFSYALAAFLLALFVRAIIFPLSQKQMMWGRQMSQLTPLINEIKAQYKGKNDPQSQQEMQKKTMALYQEYGINPMSGCAPMLLQMPLFLMIYQSMLHYRFEFQKGLFLWVNPHTNESTGGFVAANLGQKDYILIVIYGVTMVITTLLTPISDPSNAKQQRTMGISMAVLFGVMMFFWPVPSAFVLYWIFTNILTSAQSLRAYRLPLPPLVKKNAPGGGVYPVELKGNGTMNGKGSTGVPKRFKPKKKK